MRRLVLSILLVIVFILPFAVTPGGPAPPAVWMVYPNEINTSPYVDLAAIGFADAQSVYDFRGREFTPSGLRSFDAALTNGSLARRPSLVVIEDSFTFTDRLPIWIDRNPEDAFIVIDTQLQNLLNLRTISFLNARRFVSRRGLGRKCQPNALGRHPVRVRGSVLGGVL